MTALTTRDALANLIEKHKPVTNGAGWPVGCQCRDVIGFPVGQTWADHVAGAIASGAVIDADALDWAALQASLDEEIDLGGDGSTAVTTVREWLAAALAERGAQ